MKINNLLIYSMKEINLSILAKGPKIIPRNSLARRYRTEETEDRLGAGGKITLKFDSNQSVLPNIPPRNIRKDINSKTDPHRQQNILNEQKKPSKISVEEKRKRILSETYSKSFNDERIKQSTNSLGISLGSERKIHRKKTNLFKKMDEQLKYSHGSSDINDIKSDVFSNSIRGSEMQNNFLENKIVKIVHYRKKGKRKNLKSLKNIINCEEVTDQAKQISLNSSTWRYYEFQKVLQSRLQLLLKNKIDVNAYRGLTKIHQ